MRSRQHPRLIGGNWPPVWVLRDEGAGFAPPESDLVEAFPRRSLPFCQTEHVVDASHEGCVQLVPDRFHAYAVLWDPAHGRVDVADESTLASPSC